LRCCQIQPLDHFPSCGSTTSQKDIYINTTQLSEGELKSVDDLLDPKWTGKIVTSDLVQGYVYTPSTILRERKGEDFLRKLFIDQQPLTIRDRR
jgi:ABC-type Fe3+ transport system substrate-binding protein